jgi:hypothetical protein
VPSTGGSLCLIEHKTHAVTLIWRDDAETPAVSATPAVIRAGVPGWPDGAPGHPPPRGATLDRSKRYAAYLLDHGLQSLLPRTVTGEPASLAAQLTECNIEFEREDPSADWVSFYARRLVADEVEPHTDTDPGW